MIERYQLRGLSLDKAELYGKPHIGAHYTGRKGYERTQDYCCICGKPAQSCHHVIPLSRGKVFQLQTPKGSWFLRSPLFALCGTGTTGCHNDFHGGARYIPRWVWDSEEFKRRWWSGSLLSKHTPHSPALYWYGHWEILDRKTGNVITIREDV